MNALSAHPPEVRLRSEGGPALAARIWRLPGPVLSVSSAPLGGGLGLRHWVLNVQVPHDYDCDDPVRHLGELAAEAGLTGPGVGMMTAVDVRFAATACSEGINVDATVGVSAPQWAAEDEVGLLEAAAAVRPGVGTINMVIALPERLGDAALVNAVSTATEAKTQALWDAGIDGTGTATDAICILCPPDGMAQAYGGPRSTWGAPLARVVHGAVLSGCRPVGTA